MPKTEDELRKLLPLRFVNKLSFVGDCWIWTGAKNNKGYGHLGVNGKNILAHRFSYFCHRGEIPSGMTLDHECRNKLCVNPYHLRPMTQKDNNLCGEGPTAINRRKTHCIYGHEFNESNTIFKNRKDGVHRQCRACKNENRRIRTPTPKEEV